jgi:hypothetical protein
MPQDDLFLATIADLIANGQETIGLPVLRP